MPGQNRRSYAPITAVANETPLEAPTKPLAEAIAAEWDAQGERIEREVLTGQLNALGYQRARLTTQLMADGDRRMLETELRAESYVIAQKLGGS